MKSNLVFYNFEPKSQFDTEEQINTGELSDCGQVLDIEFSNAECQWEGIILEKGRSPHFYPKNVYTPYFYFALALDQELNWSAERDGSLTAIKTVSDDIWINPPKTPFTHDISEPCHFVILAIEEKTFLDSCPLNIEGMSLQFLNNYNVSDPVIKNIMDLFTLEAKTKGKNGALYLSNLVSLLSNHYIQHYSNFLDFQNAKLSASKFGQSQVDKIDQYIAENMGRPISVEDLADLLYCSKFYFLREFKKLVGVTPYQYLMNQRLEQAKSKLRLGSMTIAEISHDLGFNDQSHFTRAFKVHFGLTPGQFVKQ